MSVPKLYAWARKLSFRAFSIAFVITLIGMSLLGRWCSQQNPYQNFVRFHQILNPEAVYYPTASQLKAIAKEQLQDRKKIGVIVGGTSISNGATQPPDKLWTKHLQELLGDRYQVINFAFRGGLAVGGGGFTAQSLLDEGYKIIFTSDSVMGALALNSITVYDYFYLDALYKGLIKFYPPLDHEIETVRKDKSDYGELKVGRWLDSILYFNDLWTTIGYRYFFTVWNPLIAGSSPLVNFTKPRSQIIDPGTGYEPLPVSKRYKWLEDLTEDLVEKEHRIIAGFCQFPLEWKQDKWLVKQPGLEDINRQIQAIFPESFRSHTLVISLYRSPYYYQTAEPRYYKCWKQGTALLIKQLQKAGYWAMEFEQGLTEEDYADSVHLVASGGIKMAEAIAPKIQEIAANLGYLK